MLRFLLRTVGILILLFLALQLVRPSLPNPPVTADLQAPPDVQMVARDRANA